MSSEVQQRARDIDERLNRMRQGWEIILRRDPFATAKLSEVNDLAGVLAELLHVLAYSEPAEGGDRRE